MEGYDVGDLLGKGSFGCARLGRRRSDGSAVVVKEIHALDMKQMAAAVKEIKILSDLAHPNVIRYYDSFQDRGAVNIVTEFADGGDLALFVAKAKAEGSAVEAEACFSFFIQIVVALKYLHARKILHRDLKPANIFLMKDRTVKLGDFGVSTVLMATHNLAKTFCGTLHYLAPEVCEEKPYNNKADVWAAGCCLFELATLRRAFDAPAMLQLGMKICNAEHAPFPEGCPSDVRKLVTSMLQKNPTLRPNASKILGSDAVGRHLHCVPEALLQTERYALVFGDAAVHEALARRVRCDPEEERRAMEEWAQRDAEGLEAAELDALGTLMADAFKSTKHRCPPPAAGEAPPQVPPPPPPPARPGTTKDPELASEVSKLLATRELNFFGTVSSPVTATATTSSSSSSSSGLSGLSGFDGTLQSIDEDFTDTMCIYSPVRNFGDLETSDFVASIDA